MFTRGILYITQIYTRNRAHAIRLCVFFIVVALVLGLGPVQAMVSEEDSNSSTPEQGYKTSVSLEADGAVGQDRGDRPVYIPGEVIVKLKSIVPVIAPYGAIYQQRMGESADILSSLKKKYSLRDEKPLFGSLHNALKIDAISQTAAVGEEATASLKAASFEAPDMLEKRTGLLSIYILQTDEDAQSMCEKLNEDPDVEYAQPNYILEAQITPDDPLYSQQWAHRKIDSERAWNTTTGANDVIIAIIDTGIYYDHPDLVQNIWVNDDPIGDADGDGDPDDDHNGFVDDLHGYDFHNNDGDPNDDHGHGTHCAGIAAAAGNNTVGISGVAWNAKLMAVKGLGSNGSGSTANLANCIVYAADNGASVLSNSWGTSSRNYTSPAAEEAIDYAYSRGCVVVFAAGNSRDNTQYYAPANYPKVISAAATDSNDNKASFSNYGATVTVAAPGVSILSTVPPTGLRGDPSLYRTLSGTSMACPHVAGLAAMLLSLHGDYDSQQIKWLLQATVDQSPGLESDFFPGFGRINSASAVEYNDAPPRLIAEIAKIEIDYANQRAHIIGMAGGQDFHSYDLEYRRADGTWAALFSSSGPAANGELFEWYITEGVQEDAIVRLTVHSVDARQAMAHASLGCTRNIDPEHTSNFFYVGNDLHTQGIVRLGDSVSFIGKHFGDYSLEWSEAGTNEWSSEGVYYDTSISGHLGRWDTSVAVDAGTYNVRLSDVFGNEKFTEVILDSSIAEGWPVVMSRFNIYDQQDSSSIHTKLGNLDDDPLLEAVSMRTFDAAARLYIHDDNGTIKTGWPKVFEGEMGYSYHPTLADIDADGKDEIFISTSKKVGRTLTNIVYCLNASGDIIFRKEIAGTDYRGDICRDPIIVCDFNGDSEKEVVYRHCDAIYMLDPDGNDVPGWPKEMRALGQVMSSEGSNNLMATGNFDEDPELELAVVQYIPSSEDGFGNEIIHIFNHDGTDVAGWPQIIEGRISYDFMVCGDMDQDGLDELAITGTDAQYNKKLYLFNSEGNKLFEKDFPRGGGVFVFCMMSDLNGNGNAELVFTNYAERKVHAVDISGADIPGWPCAMNRNEVSYLGARLICDIDGDEELEILGFYTVKRPGDERYNIRLFVLGPDGNIDAANQIHDKVVPNWVSGFNYFDIDQDGYGELFFDSLLIWFDEERKWMMRRKPFLCVFKTGHKYGPTPRGWPTYLAENANTARYIIKGPNSPPIIMPIGDKKVEEGELLKFTVGVLDPDGDPVTISADPLPTGATFLNGVFAWTPEKGQRGVYQVLFTATDGIDSASESIIITVDKAQKISIKISHALWKIESIKFGQEVTFTDGPGVFLPKITNKSSVAITIDVGYVIPEGGWGQIRPGVDKIEDTFMTLVGRRPIPPDSRLLVNSFPLDPGRIMSFPFTYIAPSSLSQPVRGMRAQYEFRAYKAIE